MNLLYNLPNAILKKIWEYDPTYREKYENCLLEMEFNTSFWKNTIHTPGNNYNTFTTANILLSQIGYVNYYGQCKRLAVYANKRPYYMYHLNNNRTHLMPTFICDNNSRYDLIFNNIKSKKYIIKCWMKKNTVKSCLKKILKYT